MKLLSFPNDSTGGPEPPPPPREDCGGTHTAGCASCRPADVRMHETASSIEEWATAAGALAQEAALEESEDRRATLLAAIRGLTEAIALRAHIDVGAMTLPG